MKFSFKNWFSSLNNNGTDEHKSVYDSSTNVSLNDIIYGRAESSAGVVVNHDTALQTSVVCACVDVIAKGVSQVPFNLMKKSGRSRQPAENNDLYWLLKRGPNPYMSDYDFRYTIVQHCALTGNAFIWLNKVMGKIKEMYPLTPGSVTAVDNPDDRSGWGKNYIVTLKNGNSVTVPGSDMWVIKWRPFDGLFGLDPVVLAREAIGLSIAGEKMASSICSNGTSINGFLSAEGTLSDDAREILRKEWGNNYTGVKNTGRIAVLTAGMKYNPIQQVSAQESQLIDNRNFQISEICRMFGVQPIMVYHYLNATTYASVEQMFLSHTVHTMTPWYRLIESSANKFLLTDKEFRLGYYFKFNEQGMLRGDMTAMADWFKSNIEHGIMSPNDCREYLDMNPYDEGDIYLVPLNMTMPDQLREKMELDRKKTEADIAAQQASTKIAKDNAKAALEAAKNPPDNTGDANSNNQNNDKSNTDEEAGKDGDK